MGETREVTMQVGGMLCEHRERSATKALKSVPGITEVRQVSPAAGTARVVAVPEATAGRIKLAVQAIAKDVGKLSCCAA